MKFEPIQSILERLADLPFVGVRFCYNESRYREENSELSPGAIISRYGFWVIGTTIGGNAITLSEHDGKVRYCDHTGWYDNDMCYAAHQDYTRRNYSAANVESAQVVLATSLSEFEKMCVDRSIDSLLEELD